MYFTCTILNYTLPYYTILDYATLYFIILYYSKPYHIILYHGSPKAAACNTKMAGAPPSGRPYFQEMLRCQYKWEFNLSVCVIAHPFVCLFARLFVQRQKIVEVATSLALESKHLFVCLLVCLFASLLACLCVCLFVCLFVCEFVCSCLCLFVCLFVCAVIDKYRKLILTCIGIEVFFPKQILSVGVLTVLLQSC